MTGGQGLGDDAGGPARVQIDPADAVVDLDVMTLDAFVETRTDSDPSGRPERADLEVRVRLTGGLGRVAGPLGQPLLVDEVEALEFVAVWPAVSEEDRSAALGLLARWRDLNIPLRFLDFSAMGLLLEDGTHHLTLPPARRTLTLPDGGRLL